MPSMAGLDGKIALITGGGSEVGRAIALALAARGAKVVVTGRSERALGETVGEIAYGGGKARHVVADVTKSAEFTAAAQRATEVFGGLDILVFNAEAPAEGGSHLKGALVAVDASSSIVWDVRTDEVDALAAFLCSAAGDGLTGRVIFGAMGGFAMS